MNIDEIKDIIPHREPMLLISAVEKLNTGKDILARFDVNPEWIIFEGHFPENPVLPGVYLVEAMAQASDILILSIPIYKSLFPYFIGINNVRFMNKVKPGDSVTIQAKITGERKEKKIVTCYAEIMHGDIKCAVGEVILAMRE